MNNKLIKNIITLSLALLAIMITSTLLVIAFNNLVGFNTDVTNDDVATSISAVAFAIAVILKLLYEKKLQ